VLVDEATVIHGDHEGESWIHSGHGADDRSTPGDSRQSDFARVDLRIRSQERVRPDHVGDRVIEPLFLVGQVDVAEPTDALRPGVLMPLIGGEAGGHTEMGATRQMPA